MSLQEQLRTGLDALGISLDDERQAWLLKYLGLLLKWNKVYNLTAIRDEPSALAKHILDSLAVLPFLPKGSVADVGSGGGLPGIPLAICSPEHDVTLIESNQKKSAFQKQAKVELGLNNLSVVCARVEGSIPGQPFDVVISRAFSSISNFVLSSGHLCREGGKLFAMKGVYPEDELADLPSMFHVEQSVSLKVPGVEGERHLIVISRV